MDYVKIYNSLVANKESRLKSDGVYYENHHILPRGMGGSDTKDNLVLLTAREHFIAHRLLAKIHPENINMKLAVLFMGSITSKQDNIRYKISSRTYETLRQDVSAAKLKKASIDGAMEFLFDVKVPRGVSNTVRTLSLHRQLSGKSAKVLNKYITNMLIANSLGLTLSYPRSTSCTSTMSNRSKISVHYVLKIEKFLIAEGWISVTKDSTSPLSSRKRCFVSICVDINSILPYADAAMEMNGLDG